MSYINFESGGTLQFPRTYQLWESSFYNNTNDLGTQNNELDKQIVEAPSKVTIEEVVRDSKNRRVISKASLYAGDHIAGKNENKNDPTNNSLLDYNGKTGNNMGAVHQKPVTTKLQKKIDKAVSKPLKIDKAASMMAKMGWQGGALGKSGTGIIEPIIPNAAYATNTSGFGQPEPNQVNPKAKSSGKKNKSQALPRKQQYKLNRCVFRKNALAITLEFLRNDFETELMFDRALNNVERKQIHELMQKLNSKSLLKAEAGSGELHGMLVEIHRYQYVLTTQSEGELDGRALCVYKDAPPHMFLVTHHDLRNEPEEVDEYRTVHSNMNNECDAVETPDRESPIVIDDDEDDEVIELVDLDADEVNTNDIENFEDAIIENAQETDNYSKSAEFGSSLQPDCVAAIQEDNVSNEILKREHDATEKSEFTLNIADIKGEVPKKNRALTRKEHRERRKRERFEKYREGIIKNKMDRRLSSRQALADVLQQNVVINKQIVSNSVATRDEITNLIFEYFNAFIKGAGYSEFKFLGAFEELEVELIDEFIGDVWRFLNDADYIKDAVYTVMSGADCGVAVREDCNGSAVIYKTEKNVVATKT